MHAHRLTMDTRAATVNSHPAYGCMPVEQPKMADAPVMPERLFVQIRRNFVAAL
jgi:hypothetical protein